MEDVITVYQLPYDPQYPVVCFDEACKQLFGEVRSPRRPRRGQRAQVDYEYERKGVCHEWHFHALKWYRRRTPNANRRPRLCR